MSSLLTDLSEKCEMQAMDILALRKQVFELEDENAELRELARDACTVLRGFFVPEWFDETVLAERMHKLGIEVGDET